jgi:hypothetical protein
MHHLVSAQGTPVDDSYIFWCTDLIPEIGVTGTPVIDARRGVLYVNAKVLLDANAGTVAHRFFAIDIKGALGCFHSSGSDGRKDRQTFAQRHWGSGDRRTDGQTNNGTTKRQRVRHLHSLKDRERQAETPVPLRVMHGSTCCASFFLA